MKIIILGYSSLVGMAVSKYHTNNNDVDLVRVSRSDKGIHSNFEYYSVPNDIKEIANSIDDLLDRISLQEDSVIINCISVGDVDQCELHKEECDLINYLFVKTLYKKIIKYNFKRFIHFSSNAVYSGDNAPYDELSKCSPVNYYGEVKLKSDNFLLSKKDKRVTVVRPITLYGIVPHKGRDNPVSMIVNRLNNGDSVNLVNDIYVNILFVNDLIKVINKIIEIDFYGLINVSGDVVYSRYELGIELAKLMNKNANLVKSISSNDFNTLAKRPKNTSFDNSIMKSLGVFPTSLKESLDLIGVI